MKIQRDFMGISEPTHSFPLSMLKSWGGLPQLILSFGPQKHQAEILW
jgi:hypothetical protein